MYNTYEVNEFDTLLNEFGVLMNELNMETFFSIWLSIMGFAMIIGVVFYVLESLGLYTVAKRRGINNPWLAWIPVGCNLWILGQIGDRDNMARTGKDSKLRVWMLSLYLAMPALSVIIFSVAFAMGFAAASADGAVGSATAAGLVVAVLLLYLLFFAVTITLSVMMYVAYYRYFRSCNPQNAALYLVLGIIFGFLMPIFVFVCRNQDAPPLQPQYPQYPPYPQNNAPQPPQQPPMY